MATIPKENLDERIERIRRRNEEIEKKHREAEEDRLMALKENAMVKTKAPNDKDWPKAHKFDKLDFTYDVAPEKLEEHNKQQGNKDEPKSRRDYKKFAEGEGPPPDPSYNFLADAERDGEKSEKKEFKQNPQQKNKEQQQQYRRGGQQNNSFRGRNSSEKPGNNPKFQKQHSQPDYDSWRSERKRIDDARVSRQKMGDNRWKREWDNDKVNNSANDAMMKPERITLGDSFHGLSLGESKKSPTHNTGRQPNQQQQHLQNSHNNNFNGSNQNWNNSTAEDKRANITVSVSQTGEVKSVKLTSAPAIGTGRVGPRQVTKPQFQIQAFESELAQQQQQVPTSPRLPRKIQGQHQIKSNSQMYADPHQQNQQNASVVVANTHQYPQQQEVNNTQALNGNKIIQTPKSPVKAKAKFIPPQPTYSVNPSTGIILNTIETNPKHNANIEVNNHFGGFLANPELPAFFDGVVPQDMSHKKEFAKKSVQERLLRIRQVNPTADASATAEKADNADQSSVCIQSNDSIQAANPITA